MKKLFTLLTIILSCSYVNAQTSLGIGIGSNTTSFAYQLSVNVNTSIIGVDAGYTGALSSSQPMYFTAQAFKSIYVNDVWKVAPMAGYAYRYQSSDKKYLNKSVFIFGIEAAKHIGDRGILYGRLSFTDNTMFVVIGMRGLLGEIKRRCL